MRTYAIYYDVGKLAYVEADDVQQATQIFIHQFVPVLAITAIVEKVDDRLIASQTKLANKVIKYLTVIWRRL